MNEIRFIISAISPLIPIIVNNQRAIAIIKINISNRYTKYINISYYYFREYIEQDIMDPYYISTSEILADDFIKALNRLKFATFATSINMHG
jgi:hypothetical protein